MIRQFDLSYKCSKELRSKLHGHFFTLILANCSCIVKILYSDILYNSKILYNINCISTNVPFKLRIKFITTEIQFNVKLFGDKQCCSKEGLHEFYIAIQHWLMVEVGWDIG